MAVALGTQYYVVLGERRGRLPKTPPKDFLSALPMILRALKQNKTKQNKTKQNKNNQAKQPAVNLYLSQLSRGDSILCQGLWTPSNQSTEVRMKY